MKHQCYDYAVIGGDMRQVYLAEKLAQDGGRICHYALCTDPHKHLMIDSASVSAAASLPQACSTSSCIICPIPFSQNGNLLNQSAIHEPIFLEQILSCLKSGQSFFAGSIPEIFQSAAKGAGVHVYDLMNDPALAYFNTLATAEGAICEAMKLSPLNLHKSSCLVLGYGKCGTTLVHYLRALFCHVCVATDQEEELAKAALVAGSTSTLSRLEASIKDFDFIFNTIPAPVLTADLLALMKPDAIIIDIASAPGGVDYTAARQLGISARLYPGLPGKYAPASSAGAIKATIKATLKE